MVEVTSLNGQKLVINGDLIERIQATPDTIVSLTSGRKLIIRESVRDLLRLLTEYRRALVDGRLMLPMEMLVAQTDVPLPEAI